MDGAVLPEQAADRLFEIGQTAIGCTDHGSVFGLIPMAQALKTRGIKLIPGCEFYHVPSVQTDKEQGEKKDKQEQVRQGASVPHLTVLAKNDVGYRNLLKIYKQSFQRPYYYYKPRIDWDLLVRHQEGLIVLSGCVGGVISKAICSGREDRAYEWCRKYKEQIENFYIEILPCPGLHDMAHENPEKRVSSYVASKYLWNMAKELHLPVVLTDDGHFARPHDYELQDTLFCIGQRRKMDEDRHRIPEYHYYCTGEDILQRAREVLPFAEEQELFAAAVRTVEIADTCEVELPRGKGPLFPISEYRQKEGWTPFELLRLWINQGKKYRESLGLLPPVGSKERKKYQEREAYELSIIQHHDFSNYFLLVADIVKWAKNIEFETSEIDAQTGKRRWQKGIWCVARGSCGGSLLCWYLSVTQLDPIKFNLPVERFIDKTRNDMPDIDLDFDARYRDCCFQYLEEKYGKEHCAQIAALSTFRPRQAIRDVCDVYKIPEEDGRAIIRHLPELDNEGGIKDKGQLKRLFQEVEAIQPLLKKYPELKIAAEAENHVRAQTIHAAGFVVDQQVLEEVVGVEEIEKKPRVIACDMNFAAQQGFLKIDALSVEMMAAVAEILATIGKDFDWLYQLPLDDAPTYEMLSQGRNMGVFQLKGHSTGKLLLQLQPSHINDLVALAALGRPGPLQSGGAQEYIERKHGRMAMPEYHKRVMEVLGDTYGVVIYQEQVMGLMRVAGFDWPDVHKIRKLISKSGGAAAVETFHPAYLAGMKKAGVPVKEAEHLWEQCKKAGGYAFNRAHGAAYAMHGYWTAYLKCHYPGTFACIMAKHEKKEAFQRQILRDFQQQGGKLILLDPNQSERKFSSPDPNTILGGFETIKGVGPNHAEQLVKGQPYRDWTDFFLRAPKALAHDLQQAGIHKGEIDLDSALVIAPWFVEVAYLPLEEAIFHRKQCHTIREVQQRMESGGDRVARLVGRITDLQLSAGKKQSGGVSERLLVTITDPTGSVDVWFSGWKWEEIKKGRDPLRGPTEGLGNSVYCVAVISDDRTRLFGEDLICFRESKGLVHEQTRKAIKAAQQGEDEEKVQKRLELSENPRHPAPKENLRAKWEAQLAMLE